MMKRIFVFALLCGMTAVGLAQDKALPLDERGKLIYYEVVEKKEVDLATLKERARLFFDKAKELTVEVQEVDSLWYAKGKLLINKTAFVLSRPSGEVLYRLYVDFKPGKYRFWLTDFSFIPYQRDRYGNFVPSTTIGIPLERKQGKLNAGEWESYVKATAREVKLFAERFKQSMSEQPINPPTAKAVPTVATKNQKW